MFSLKKLAYSDVQIMTAQSHPACYPPNYHLFPLKIDKGVLCPDLLFFYL